MKILVPLLLIATVIAVALGGATGAGAVFVAGLVLAVVATHLSHGDVAAPRSGPPARRAADVRFLVLLVVGGFVVRAGLAVVLRELDLNMVLGGDEGTFDGNARVFHAWLEGQLPQPFQAKWAHSSQVGYFVLVGCLYWVFGVVQMVPVLLNCLIGALTALPVYGIAARLGGRLAGRAAAVLVTIFPSLLLWSCLLVRDALAVFLIASCVLLGQDLLRRLSPARVALLVVCLGGLATLRSYIFLLLSAALVVAFLVSAVRRPGRALGLAFLAIVGVLVLVRGAGLGAELVGEDYLVRIDEQRRLNAIVGNAAIDLGAHDLATPTGALTYLPVGLTYFLLAPFPWQMGGRQALALPDMLLWYLCLPLVVLGAFWSYRHRRTQALVPLIAGVSISFLYALVEGNVGIIVRHRAQVLVLFLPYAGVQIARMVRARQRRRTADAGRRDKMIAASPLRARRRGLDRRRLGGG